MRKTTQLRRLLALDRAALAAGAHNGLSARLAERAGFDAVWASGFEISASHAVPDANILTMSEALDAARDIAAGAARTPVLADADNGFGNAVNVRRAVRDYDAAGIAGICIEDNAYPKRCSFYTGVGRDLVPVEEHAGKIRAAVEARQDPHFTIVARTEALIAGLGMDEALARARAYAAAGADAILVHSKSKDGAEILEFGRRWPRDAAPLVAVPTTYSHVHATDLHDAGYRLVIFANHGLRAAVRATAETLAKLRRCGQAAAVEPDIAPLDTIYDLVNVQELRREEAAYIAKGSGAAVILAAGRDSVRRGVPKCMLAVRGRTILQRQVDALRAAGVGRVTVVRGYLKDRIHAEGVDAWYDNDAYQATGEAGSLLAAVPELAAGVLIVYGDILFDPSLAQRLLACRARCAILVDRRPVVETRPRDLVSDDAGPARIAAVDPPARLVRIGPALEGAHGEFAGLLRLASAGLPGGVNPAHSLPEMLQAAVDAGEPVEIVDTWGGWIDVDTLEDYRRVCEAPLRTEAA
jgi:phosphoenolpyruvate phosphomutase